MPITTKMLETFKRRLFIETGTHVGDGVQSALNAGFEEVWSVELDVSAYEISKNRFKDKPVTLYFGTSLEFLESKLSVVNEPATMWLDAHGPDFPIAEELDMVHKYGRNDHILLLDDIWKTDTHVHLKYKLYDRLYAINPNYKIYFVDGQTDGLIDGRPHAVIPNSIMVADPR